MEVCQNRGQTLATIGLIQLILDVLKKSCINPDRTDFKLPITFDLISFDMNRFIKAKIRQKVGQSIRIHFIHISLEQHLFIIKYQNFFHDFHRIRNSMQTNKNETITNWLCSSQRWHDIQIMLTG